MATATITSKGQVTIPKEVRERLRLAAGDRLEFRIAENGGVQLHPLGRSVSELYGMLHRPGRPPVSVTEMDESIASFLEEEDRRTTGPSGRRDDR